MSRSAAAKRAGAIPTGGPIGSVLFGLCIGAVCAAGLLAAISFLATIYDVPDTVMTYFVVAVNALSVFAAGFSASAKYGGRGLIVGSLTGLSAAAIIRIFGCAFIGSLSYAPYLVAGIAVQCVIAALGGIVGVNVGIRN